MGFKKGQTVSVKPRTRWNHYKEPRELIFERYTPGGEFAVLRVGMSWPWYSIHVKVEDVC